jgi:outer membrane protein TolC
MGPDRKKTGWMVHALLVGALGAAVVSAPAATPRAAPAGALAVPAPSSRCVDDETTEPKAAPARPAATPGSTPPPAASTKAPRMNLLSMVQDAIRHSNSVGAAKLLAEAAAIDIDEVRAARLPSVGLSGQVGGIDAGAPGSAGARGAQFQAGVTVTAPLYDSGRITDLTSWRSHLAEAARLGELTAQEQVALQTVSLALERSRYTVESQVYEQYARKMGCLVDALTQIVSVDKGRTSELVQARKTQQQAELARDQSLSQKRLAEVRLKRFVGDNLPPTEGITSVMLDIPSLPDLLVVAARSSEVQALGAQADALESYVRAVLDGQKPQLGWLLSAGRSAGAGNSHSVSGGVTFSVPLYSPANDYTTNAAKKRAEAARLQRQDALEARQFRMREVHEQAEHSMDRARHVVDVLHNSELVRNFTLQQWQQLGRRSLFDVMAAEGDHYNMRVQYVDALYDTQQSNALLWSLGLGLAVHLE